MLEKGLLYDCFLPKWLQLLSCSQLFVLLAKSKRKETDFLATSEIENRAATEIRLGSGAVAMFGSESLLSCLCGSESRQGTVVLSAGEEDPPLKLKGVSC